MKKSIFITGIAGLLGSNVAYLLRKKYDISGIDRNEIDIKGVNTCVGNVQDISLVEELMIRQKTDVLIHCAALVNVDICEERPEEGRAMNYTLTKELALICKKNNIKMIFISTDAVFDGKKDGLNNESDLVAPVSMYGKMKAEAEKEVLLDPKSLVVRTNIYGYNLRDKRSFGEWVRDTLQDNLELHMFTDVYFSPILVNDLAMILEQCICQDVCGLYHICSTGSISKYDIAVCIRETLELEGSITKSLMKNFEFKAPRTHNMGLDNTKIKRRLGIEIRTPQDSVLEFKRLSDDGYPERLKAGGYDE